MKQRFCTNNIDNLVNQMSDHLRHFGNKNSYKTTISIEKKSDRSCHGYIAKPLSICLVFEYFALRDLAMHYKYNVLDKNKPIVRFIPNHYLPKIYTSHPQEARISFIPINEHIGQLMSVK